MSVYYMVVNHTKKEFLDPLDIGAGFKLFSAFDERLDEVRVMVMRPGYIFTMMPQF